MNNQITLIYLGDLIGANKTGLHDVVTRLGVAFEYQGMWFVRDSKVSNTELLERVRGFIGAAKPTILTFDAAQAILPDTVKTYFQLAKAA